MTARSIVRAHEREQRRAERRRRAGSVGRRAAIGAVVATGVGALAASGAQAADFPVSNNSDAGAGSLRAAILAANGTAAPDTISFVPGLTGSIDLATEIPITAPLAINGPGAETLRVTGSGRIFDVGNIAAPDQAVSISGLTLAKGSALGGGAIRNSLTGGQAAELTVSDSVLTGQTVRTRRTAAQSPPTAVR